MVIFKLTEFFLYSLKSGARGLHDARHRLKRRRQQEIDETKQLEHHSSEEDFDTLSRRFLVDVAASEDESSVDEDYEFSPSKSS